MRHLGKWKTLAIAAAVMAIVNATPADAERDDPNTLTVGMMWESQPYSMKSRRSRFFNESEVLDTLIKLDYEMKMVPGLAVSWDRTSDTEWVFNLREGVRFHDGTPLTAESVVYSLDRVVALLPYAAGLLDIAEIKAEGPLAVKIRTNKPFGALANQLTDAITGIYGRASFDEAGEFVKPIGTGPFEFISYAKQDRTVVERYDGYWGQAPALEKVVYRYIPDHAARTLSLETGEIDMAVNIPPADVKRLGASDDFQVHRAPAAGLYYMVLNTVEGTPFADVRVRTAVNLLVDREALVTYALDGVGSPAGEFFSPGFKLVPSEQPKYTHDEARAETLMQEAGYAKEDGFWTKDGEVLMLNMMSYSSRTEMPLITEAVANMFTGAGIKSSINMYTWPGMLGLVQKGEYDAYAVFWTPEMTGHPDMHLKGHFHSDQAMMYNGYADSELDSLLIAGRGLDAGAERDATYGKALEIIHRDAPIIPLVHKVYVAASYAGLTGFRVHPSGFFYNFKAVSKK